MNSYNKAKNYVHCHRITRLCFDKNNKLTDLDRNLYEKDQDYISSLIRKPSAFNKLTGAGMVLYPPQCFDKEVFNIKLFERLAPTSDDIWFHLQALRNGFKVKVVENNLLTLNCIDGTQDVGLCQVNDASDGFFNIHLNAVYNYYSDLKEMFLFDNKNNLKIIHYCRICKLLQNIFSIKRNNRNTHTIITIFGVKFQLKNF